MPRNRIGAPVLHDVFYSTFYWIGIAMAVACVFLILAGNTESLWRFEHARIPLSWVAGAVAMLAFLLAELCDSALAAVSETQPSQEIAREVLQQEL